MDYCYKTAKELHKLIKTKEASALDITKSFLDRIEREDPHLNSFIDVYHEESLAKAKVIDEKIAKGENVGSLAGVPVAIKDNIHIKGEITTCASKILKDYKAPYSATVVENLQKEDAILIGKTNMDEFAMGSGGEFSVYGPSLNPWGENKSPGGSSSGSASCVAARLVPLSLGSDTGGSIRLPASFCGCYGFKPTYGMVSRFGLVAFGSSMDQIGPFANSVEDIAFIMNVLSKRCRRDATHLGIDNVDYVEHLDANIRGKTIGVPFSLLKHLKDDKRELFTQAVDKLKALDVNIIDVTLDRLNLSIPVYYILAPAEASTNLARFDGIGFTKRAENVQTLQELYAKSRSQGFGPEVKQRIILGTYVLSSSHRNEFYVKAQQVRKLIIQDFAKAYEKCDVIVMPTAPHEAYTLGEKSDPISAYLQDIFTIGGNMAGLPGINIPYCLSEAQMPLGMQILGPYKSDLSVLQFANAMTKLYEDTTWVPPKYSKA